MINTSLVSDIVSIIAQLFAYGILFMVIVYVIKEFIKALIGVPSLKSSVRIIPINPKHVEPFCGLSKKHIHYRIFTIISYRGEKYAITLYYCPETNKAQVADSGKIRGDRKWETQKP